MKTPVKFLVLLLVITASCGIDVPEDKIDYVGYWHGPETLLEIKKDGSVSYFHKEGDNVTTIDSPLQEFEGADFTIGVLLFTETFEVSKPPYQDTDGQWKMVVNDVELIRQDDLPPELK